MSATGRDMSITRLNGTFLVRCIITLAKAFGFLLPFRNDSSLFFFFPFMHVGGAEKVHSDIVGCFSGEKPWVFFTKRSDNDKFRSHFPVGAHLFNIWPLLKYGYPFSVGVMAGFVNRHKSPVVFGSNSLFYYLMIPYLKPHVRRVDLMHAFGGASDEFSLPVVEKIDWRVVINGKTTADLKAQYMANHVDPRLLDRIVLIENRVTIPQEYPKRIAANDLTVIFVGRGAPEKRVHLVGKAATRCTEKMIPARFVLVGDIGEAVEACDRANCLWRGEIANPSELEGIYREADVLVLTSDREGFPIVIMEAMAHGVVPVCTDVGGISRHLRHGSNGILLENGAEEKIVEGLVSSTELLCKDRKLLKRLSLNAFEYARATFDSGTFCSDYRRLILDK
jgi:glycosyltransferase involved in cell wall biosynthesis